MVATDESPRILFVRLSALGDILFALPTFAHLRMSLPKAHITWLVDDRAANLLRGYPGIDELLVFPRKAWAEAARDPRQWKTVGAEAIRFCSTLRNKRFDISLDLQGNMKSGVLAFLARARRRIGFAPPVSKEGNRIFNNEKVSVPKNIVHRTDRDLELLKGLGLEPSYRQPEIPIDPDDRQQVRLALAGLWKADEADRPLVLIHPGTSQYGKFKRWPTDRFGELSWKLSDEFPCRIAVSWGPGERHLAEEVAATSNGVAKIAPATDSLAKLCAMLCEGALVIGADTGPLQIASIMGIPVVALYGPKNPNVYAPLPRSSPVEVIWAQVPCSPCTFRQCDLRICMTEIQTTEVAGRAARLLRAHNGRTCAST